MGESKSSRLFGAALANTGAVVIALQETGARVTLANAGRPAGVAGVIVAGAGRRCLAIVLIVLVIAVGGELGLDGGRVNAVGVQAAAHLARQAHVPLRALALDFRVDLDVD